MLRPWSYMLKDQAAEGTLKLGVRVRMHVCFLFFTVYFGSARLQMQWCSASWRRWGRPWMTWRIR